MIQVVIVKRGITREDLGFIPTFLSEDDPRPAHEQLDANYRHGGGWRPQEGFTLLPDYGLSFPQDPPMEPWAVIPLREEMVVLYNYGYVCIVQKDGSFEVARMD